jgi:hypothetical protein
MNPHHPQLCRLDGLNLFLGSLQSLVETGQGTPFVSAAQTATA